MEKQIKTVWILTIITALLIIGGQAYWLYNQYGYSADEHMRNLHAEILKLENAEFEARYKQRTVNTPMTLSYSIEMPDLTNSKGNSRCVITLTRNLRRVRVIRWRRELLMPLRKRDTSRYIQCAYLQYSQRTYF